MATKTWREIQAKHSKHTPEQREAHRQQAVRELELERLTLSALRRARSMTQATVAQNADMAQGDVSRLEHRTDAYIGTVRRFIEAMGGSMRIVVEFPDRAPVEIDGFGEYGEPLRDQIGLNHNPELEAERIAYKPTIRGEGVISKSPA
jgi:transcriptional regulator with XRE-family HTH domain